MTRRTIAPDQLLLRSFHAWDQAWFLLSAGDFAAGRFNCMTVSWGSLGTIWGKPLAMAVVRPQRHTYGFMEQADSFTLCAFGASHRDALRVLGTRSGREMDKVNASGLTPVASAVVASPSYQEAELVIECRKTYFQDLDPAHFLADYIADCYDNDFHRMYFGEVLALSASEPYILGG
jgi:flavin reductase (DIM6/NTAB) family NADH-FMN oxidoreductase RutF